MGHSKSIKKSSATTGSSAMWDQASLELDELWLEIQRHKDAMADSAIIHCVESISCICSLPLRAKPIFSHDGRWLQPGQLAFNVCFSIGEILGEPMEPSTLLRLLEADRNGRVITSDAPYLKKSLALMEIDKAQALDACQRAKPWIAQFHKGIEHLHSLGQAFEFLHMLSLHMNKGADWRSEHTYTAIGRPDLAAKSQRTSLALSSIDPARGQTPPRI